MKHIRNLLTVAAVSYTMVACQQSRTPNYGNVNQPNPFTDTTQNDALGGAGDLFGDDFGSDVGGSGDLTDAQENTVQNLLDELAQFQNPEDPDQLPADLANALLAESPDPQAAYEKMALAGQVLSHCMQSVEDYLPRPGEPLQGQYAGKCGGTSLNMTITGIYQKIFKRRLSSNDAPGTQTGNSSDGSTNAPNSSQTVQDTVNNGFVNGLGLGNVKFRVALGNAAATSTSSSSSSNSNNGVMNVNSNGVGTLKVAAYTGGATDIAGNGKPAPRIEVKREESGSGKHITPGCNGTLTMKSSSNPIPEKYVQMIKKVTACYNKALGVMQMDRAFEGMNPQLKRLLINRILGISTSGS